MRSILRNVEMKLLIVILIAIIGIDSSRRVHKCKTSEDMTSRKENQSFTRRQKRSDRIFLIGMVVGNPMTDSPTTEYKTVHTSTIRKGTHRPLDGNMTIVSRTEWGARLPQDVIALATPVPLVIIHHSYLIKACKSRRGCTEAMRDIQDYHMDYRGWWDIGYNFCVGGDGAAYEGRGWDKMGAHALHWNNVSIGICAIGDWSVCTPPAQQLNAIQALIALGVEQGYIKPDYQLIGHHQTRASTKCPGDALYREIKTWGHWTDNPAQDDTPSLSASSSSSSTSRPEGEY